MGYARGVVYFIGILIIITGLYFIISASSIIGALTGIIGMALGIIFIWKVRKIGKQEKRLKK